MHPSSCSSIHPSIHSSMYAWSVYPYMHAYMYPSIHPSTHAYMYSSIHLSIHPCIHPLSNLFTHPFIHPIIHPSSIHPFTHSSICPYTHPFIHPSTHSCNHPFSPLCWAPASWAAGMRHQEIKEGKDVLIAFSGFTFLQLKIKIYTRGQCDPINLAMQDGSCCVSITHLDFYFQFSVHYGGETSSQSNF